MKNLSGNSNLHHNLLIKMISFLKLAVDVARETMKLIDKGPGVFDAKKLVAEARERVAGDLTGLQEGTAVQMVSKVHSRGEEFRLDWNKRSQAEEEGEKR